MISRRGKEVVVFSALRRRSRNAEISHFLASLRQLAEGGRITAIFYVARRSRILQIRIVPHALNLAGIRSAQLITVRTLPPLEDTILQHLEKLTADGEEIDLEYLQPPKERFKKIKMAFQQSGARQLTPVREILGEDFSYQELRLVRLSIEK